uniref:3,4-dihydroxy-2-butanone-4-phosphate synthase n=1 Tax=Rhodosorus marinus TaxID=101924 RepID=A0A7S3A141_9RHOD|mmetsp:Transcript_37037/g.147788  ORF Transcript_37037/g.147788 Transcript_37037/m.147788 type:complete len:426 (+) Transcript_37037:244-1521(+)|eukprot:CAMPEP_0113965764 /NCGR_PEP_ID=MMETSP0011_2-20120614/7936_1 /TAXON_ID=101924 /ORGANISM="Rhodosorus marinus" /LENGTH=425 /DNA_ID=CAMNT_0000978333 /DNA_START=77 /DNA_END=1354 /DNA_ORIENTATION=+ /assembly_acc=CAM_ASM_000156
MAFVGSLSSGRAFRNGGVKVRQGRGKGVVMVLTPERASIPSLVASESFETPVVESLEDGWCFGEESVLQAIEAVRRGEMVLVTDDAGRENEGDLIMAAEMATTESIAFMVRHSSGVICASITGEVAKRLQLTPMVPSNTDPKQTAFTVSCDYKYGTSTGISAADRALTLNALANSNSIPEDFYRPGHIFPLRAREDGVLRREGHTEAAVDLAEMAGCSPAGVLVEVVDHSDGSMARRPYLEVFAKEHGLVMTSVADMIEYRKRHESHVIRLGEESARLPTSFGLFDTFAYRSRIDETEHLALVKGDVAGKGEVLVRVEFESVAGHVFASVQDTCRQSLEKSLEIIQEEEEGVLVYLRKGSDGKMSLAEELYGAGAKDSRSGYQAAAQILQDLEVSSVRLLSNNAGAASQLKKFGLNIASEIPFSF